MLFVIQDLCEYRQKTSAPAGTGALRLSPVLMGELALRRRLKVPDWLCPAVMAPAVTATLVTQLGWQTHRVRRDPVLF